MRVAAFALISVASLAGCGAESLDIACMRDSDCDDHVFCNGEETCVGRGRSTTCVRVPRDCSALNGACGPAVCNESARSCERAPSDVDGDGHDSIVCGGDDCDDNDSGRYPGATEVCDMAGHDEDCDDTTYGTRDQDGDGYVDAACCNGTVCGPDCNDNNPGVHPNQAEVCNGLDDDCDGSVDEGLTVPLYVDADRDGYGAAGGTPVHLCTGAPGYSALNNDCDDTNAAITPGTMVCDLSTPQVTSDVRICTQDGTWLATTCSKGTTSCVVQPTGLGICL
jgi:hypothetical protein